MNKWCGIGRLTKDPDVKNTASQVTVCKFTVAVDRKYKDSNGQRQTDFINCVAWRQTANFISQYFHKGSRIGLIGSIQTRTYDDDNGNRQYITEVVVDEAEFVESKSSSEQSKPVNHNDDYMVCYRLYIFFLHYFVYYYPYLLPSYYFNIFQYPFLFAPIRSIYLFSFKERIILFIYGSLK